MMTLEHLVAFVRTTLLKGDFDFVSASFLGFLSVDVVLG